MGSIHEKTEVNKSRATVPLILLQYGFHEARGSFILVHNFYAFSCGLGGGGLGLKTAWA